MDKETNKKGFWLLVFLAFFGLSIGVFDNYRDLWMSVNDISAVTISHIKSISNIVTVLALFYFTLRVPIDKLKKGMNIVLILKMIIGVILVFLNGTQNFFSIKFLMFFDIAFTQLILSSTYPLMMNFAKSDVLYAKKGFVESFFDKIGLLLGSIILGKVLIGYEIDYNSCLMISLLFTFISFVILISINIESQNKKETLNVKKTVRYFKENKLFLFFLGHNMLGSTVWTSLLGMQMLLLTKNLEFSSQMASFLILGLGVISTIMSMVIVKYLRFKNDQINIIFKFGIRVILYIACVITGSPQVLFATIVYMLLTNSTHNFIFSSFFVNIIDEEYSLVLTTMKYCATLIGDAIGLFLCGLTFEGPIMYFALPAATLGIIHYILSIILVEKKKTLINKENSGK